MWIDLLIWPLIIILLYFLYVFITTAVLFIYIKAPDCLKVKESDIERFYGNEEGPDKALIIEHRPFSLHARINLIEQAQVSIKIAYFAITNGTVSDVFYGQILEAADRGVVVHIIFDGMGQNLIGEKDSVYWALVKHPFIKLRFYERNSRLSPWRWNNLMHDKILIVDDTFAMTGGRNLEDRFHLGKFEGESVEDRDVLIVKRKEANVQESCISQFLAYFDELWTHPFTKEMNRYVPVRLSELAYKKHKEAFTTLDRLKASDLDAFNQSIDWKALAEPTRKITLITNPVERLKKDPYILKVLQALLNQAETSVLIQSPFIVPGKEMQRYFDFGSIGASVYYLTNSSVSSPNPFALSGQIKYKDYLAEKADQIYEYQGEGSIHGKAYVIDDRLSLIGSFNLDPRSAFLSTENMVVIDSVQVAQDLSENIYMLMKQSVPVVENRPDPVNSPMKLKMPSNMKKRQLAAACWLMYFFEDIL